MTIGQIEEFLRRGQEAQKDIDRILEEQDLKHDTFCTAPADPGNPCTCGQNHKLITKPWTPEDTPLRKDT